MAGLTSISSRKQSSELRHQDKADEGDAATGDQLLDALALCSGIVIAITLHEINTAPDSQSRAKGDHDLGEHINCICKKTHSLFLHIFGVYSGQIDSHNLIGVVQPELWFVIQIGLHVEGVFLIRVSSEPIQRMLGVVVLF